MNTANPFQAPMEPTGAALPDPSRTIGWILTSFSGRIPRRVFWGATLSVSIVFYIAVMAISLLAGPSEEGQVPPLAAMLILPLYAVLVWFSLAISVKRWHDRGKSGWCVLLGLIPIVGPIWVFIETGCLRGTKGPNEYGPDPT